MPSSHDLLKNALILDTETTGLARGSGIHELAIFDLDKQEVHEYLLKPQLVFARDRNHLQDVTRLASSSLDEHFVVPGISTWRDLIVAQVSMETGKSGVSIDDVQRSLAWSNPFLADALKKNKYPHLMGKPDSPQQLHVRAKRLADMGGVRAELGKQTALEDVLRPGSAFLRKLRGKTIWIANANFESKMLGAQIDGMVRAAHDVQARRNIEGMKRMMETQNPSISDPFYVTGKEVNAARAFAQQTGDWTHVWKAYLANPPRAGQTAVRDIQDVTRAFMSYGRKLGLTNVKDQYFGNAIDLTYRLFGSLEEDPATARRMLLFDEVHRAAEDAAISENYVLRRAVKYTSALQEVAEGTTRGQELLTRAMAGEGELAEAGKYFARLDQLAGDIQRVNLVKRVARAQEDLLRQGQTFQVSGISGFQRMKQLTAGDQPVEVVRAVHSRTPFSNMRDVVSFIDERQSYQEAGTTAQELYGRMSEFLSRGDNKRELLSQWVESETTTEMAGRKMGIVEAKIKAEADMLLATENRQMGKVVTRQFGQKASDIMRSGLSGISRGTLMKGAVAGMGAATAAGMLWSMTDGNKMEPRVQAPSIVSFNYHEWLERQAQFSGSRQHDSQGRDGLAPTGIAERTRRFMTDFGSPYKGPMTSNAIMADQELLREREKWLREQYGARHFDPVDGVFGLYGAFKDINMFGRQGYRFVQGGTPVRYANKMGLRGNLMALNLSDGNWKVSADDADTITIRRGGVRGALANMFGMNKGYSFRLAGIDSTEVSHGSTSYHAPQPHADAAAEAFRSLIKGSKSLELVYDPTNTTYGRMMGAVIADGKNLNFEVVRRGIAAHLPYGKADKSMIDYQALKKLERSAYQAERGLWAHPWARSFYDFSEASGNRMTFNTLARKDRIVEKTAVMSQLALMETAQSMGFYNTADRMAASQLGKFYDIGADNVAPVMFDQRNAPHNNHLHEMLRDTADFVRTKGTGRQGNKTSRRGGYGNLDNNMSLDTMGTTNTIWNKRKLRAFDSYGTQSKLRKQRRQRMAEEQRRINQQFGVSSINHHRM